MITLHYVGPLMLKNEVVIYNNSPLILKDEVVIYNNSSIRGSVDA